MYCPVPVTAHDFIFLNMFMLCRTFIPCTNFHHIQSQVGICTFRSGVQRIIKELLCFLKCTIFQAHKAPLNHSISLNAARYWLRLIYNSRSRISPLHSRQKLLNAPHQILDRAHFAHVLGLEFGKLLGHIIGIDALVAGNQVLGFVPCHELEIAAPLVLDPHSVIVFIIRAKGQHDFGGVQSGEDIRLIFLPQLVFQGNAGEEDTVALLRQGIVNILGNDAVHGALTVLVRLLIADENVIRLLLAGNLDDALADFLDLLGLLPIDLAGDHVRIFQSLLKVAVLHDALKAGAVAGRNFLAGGRVVHILDAVLAQH